MKYILLCFLALAFEQCQADDNMHFHGTLVAPPCTINNDQTIEVSFGEAVGIDKVDSGAYSQEVDYHITCDGSNGYEPYHLSLVITGDKTTFNESAITTSQPALGIEITVDGVKVNFGQPVNVVSTTKLPEIMAMLVKDPAIDLVEGTFTAAMTLQTDYY